jgi:hypothetical protein
MSGIVNCCLDIHFNNPNPQIIQSIWASHSVLTKMSGWA